MRWLIAGGAVLLALALPGAAQAAPYSSHSQLYACCTDSATKEAMFREAKDSGAAYIRVDFELEGMFEPGSPPTGPGPTRWRRCRASIGSRCWPCCWARRRRTPTARSVEFFSKRMCPPADPGAVGQPGRGDRRPLPGPDRPLPDRQRARRRLGLPRQRRGLRADAVGRLRRDPRRRARRQGGAGPDHALRLPGHRLAGPGVPHAGHGRGQQVRHRRDAHCAATRGGWCRPCSSGRRSCAAGGATCPCGSPSTATPPTRAGSSIRPTAAARRPRPPTWPQSLPALAKAGAAQVFVTLRDGGEREYEAEGILAGRGLPGQVFRRKPAFWAVRHAAARWGLPEPVAPPPPVPVPVARTAVTAPLLWRPALLSTRVGRPPAAGHSPPRDPQRALPRPRLLRPGGRGLPPARDAPVRRTLRVSRGAATAPWWTCARPRARARVTGSGSPSATPAPPPRRPAPAAR